MLGHGAADASHSIAVLPFTNLSDDPAQGYFADGIAGEIRNTLAQVAGLKVAGSTSSDAVREDDAQTAARKLGVSRILTGNVRQTPSTIRVTAELIDGATGLTKWSQNYDRAPGDAIMIQTDIAGDVARELAVALSASDTSKLAPGETGNLAAQTLVFQARNESYQLTVPALQQSLKLLDTALALDPNYARTYAMKSFVANNLVTRTARTPADLASGREQALQFARTALEIAPDLPIARSALGFAYQLNLRMGDALREQQIALSLASGDPDVIRNYGLTMGLVGKQVEALRYVDEALALDPLNAHSHRSHVNILFNARRYAEAVRYCEKLRKDSPKLFTFPQLLGHSLLMLDRPDEAAVAFADHVTGQALVAARTGNRELALAKLAALKAGDLHFVGLDSARIHAQLGDVDASFAELDRAWKVRESALVELRVDPYLDPLRGDPRFPTHVERLGFPD